MISNKEDYIERFLEKYSLTFPPLRYENRDIVFHSQANPDHFYFVKSGKIRVFLDSCDGKEYTVSLLRQGDIYSGHARGIGKAIEAGEVILIPKEVVVQLLQQSPQFTLNLIQTIGKTLNHTFNIIESLVFHNVEARIIYFLNYTAEKVGVQREGNIFVTVGLTQEEIATMVGCSRQTVNQILKELEARNWIKLKSKEIEILKIDEMRKNISL